MFNLDDLIDSAINEGSNCNAEPDSSHSITAIAEWEKFAHELDAAAEREGLLESNLTKAKSSKSMMHKLAMATILDVIDDPIAQPFIKKLSSEVDEIAKIAFESPEPGTIGGIARAESLDAQTFVKNKVGKGKTIFEKLKSNDIKEDK